jgi:GAF domain-containing protein
LNHQGNFKKSSNSTKNNELQLESINSTNSEDIPELDYLKKILTSEKLPTLKEISNMIMEIAKKSTDSEHCYVAYVDPKNGDSVGVSFSHMTEECDAYAKLGEARFPVRKNGTYGGLLGYSLDTGKSFYVRDPASHPAAHGMPPGHEHVDQFLSVPVIYEGNILGQIVLGNPKENYTHHHLEIADKIANVYSLALKKLLY